VASVGSFDELCSSFLDEWSGEASPVIGASGKAITRDLDFGVPAPEAVRMMYYDAVTYLPDDILCKVDRASMAVSLETRVPFLDHRVAEFAARVPLAMKVEGGRGKAILRKLLYGMVPKRLVDRPKAGFGIPVGEWIKGPLRDWAEDLLDPSEMRSEGLLDPMVVQQRWRDHLSGRRDSTPALWAMLMFQAWLKQQTTMGATAVEIASEL
jgi:asparagine synthase (glutamine-hydrolysing)